ncbi:type II toxin-antitoxin system Phd/YefM family antitoxin [bacterium]|nr:type II toxin-antitoxin system Phd/YefM family antitoxin [bacterium]
MASSIVSKLKTSTVRDDFSEIINRVAYGKEHVILTRRGKDLAALVPADELDLFRSVLEKLEDELDITEAKRRLSDKKQSRISYKVLRKEIGLK